jgi:hypothetical protein
LASTISTLLSSQGTGACDLHPLGRHLAALASFLLTLHHHFQ